MPWKVKSGTILLVLVIGVAGYFVWQTRIVERLLTTGQGFFRDSFKPPRGGETKTQEIIIQDNEVIGTKEEFDSKLQNQNNQTGQLETKEIMITGGVKHSVPLDEIVGGGPPKDGIPSIDNPKFVVAADASFITNEEPGLAVEIDGIARFYPFQIMVWHEIVNDNFNGKRVLVTYCPLCLSGIVFDPVVKGERAEFGTSGKLWNSNLVMYDRKTDSLWSQILGEAIVGEMTGTKLAVLPSDMVRFGDFRKKYPNGEVLSRDTGATRFYGQDPYGDYYTTPGTYFSVSNKDNRLNEKDFVLGIVVNGKAKAYFPPAVKQKGEIIDKFAGKTIVVRYEKDIDAVRLFSAEGGSASGGEKKLERINPFAAFWFSWAAAHPDTELYK